MKNKSTLIKRKHVYSSLDLSSSNTIIINNSSAYLSPLESEFGLSSREESDSDDSDIELSLFELYNQLDTWRLQAIISLEGRLEILSKEYKLANTPVQLGIIKSGNFT